MYKIRFTNIADETIITTICNEKDFKKISETVAKNSIVECKMDSNMPTSLHNAIADHNLQITKGII